MAPFKRSDSKYYWIGPFRAGAVDVPRMSTGQTNKTAARAMEDALRNRAVAGYADLVRMVADKSVSLVDFYTADIRGPEALDELLQQENDRPLAEVVQDYRIGLQDERAMTGLDQLLALAPVGARFSWVKASKNLSGLYRDAVRGLDRENRPRSKGSVRGSLHRAVSGLLARELGRGQMLAIMADVSVPSAQDERSVMMSMEEIRSALITALHDFRAVLGYMLTTGIDLGPMLGPKSVPL